MTEVVRRNERGTPSAVSPRTTNAGHAIVCLAFSSRSPLFHRESSFFRKERERDIRLTQRYSRWRFALCKTRCFVQNRTFPIGRRRILKTLIPWHIVHTYNRYGIHIAPSPRTLRYTCSLLPLNDGVNQPCNCTRVAVPNVSMS